MSAHRENDQQAFIAKMESDNVTEPHLDNCSPQKVASSAIKVEALENGYTYHSWITEEKLCQKGLSTQSPNTTPCESNNVNGLIVKSRIMENEEYLDCKLPSNVDSIDPIIVLNETQVQTDLDSMIRQNLALKNSLESARRELETAIDSKVNSTSVSEMKALESSVARLRMAKKELKKKLSQSVEECLMLKGTNNSLRERNGILENEVRLYKSSFDIIQNNERASEFDSKIQEITSNLQCSICHEIFVFSTTINCGHTFCNYCIQTWKTEKDNCPLCRSSISILIRNNDLDNYIAKMVESFPLGCFKNERKNLMDYRKTKLGEAIKNNSEGDGSELQRPRTAPEIIDERNMAVTNGIGTGVGMDESDNDLEEFLQSVRAVGLSRAIGVLTNSFHQDFFSAPNFILSDSGIVIEMNEDNEISTVSQSSEVPSLNYTVDSMNDVVTFDEFL